MSALQTTVPVRLYPTPAQAAVLRAHTREYIATVNVLVQALDADVLPGGKSASTADFTAALPSAVKNQALRDARLVWHRSFDLGVLPVLRRPICQWNNQNWRIEGDALILLPVSQDGKVHQAVFAAPLLRWGASRACSASSASATAGSPRLLLPCQPLNQPQVRR